MAGQAYWISPWTTFHTDIFLDIYAWCKLLAKRSNTGLWSVDSRVNKVRFRVSLKVSIGLGMWLGLTLYAGICDTECGRLAKNSPFTFLILAIVDFSPPNCVQAYIATYHCWLLYNTQHRTPTDRNNQSGRPMICQNDLQFSSSVNQGRDPSTIDSACCSPDVFRACNVPGLKAVCKARNIMMSLLTFTQLNWAHSMGP